MKINSICTKLLECISFDRIDLHIDLPTVLFADLAKMQPGDPSAVIRERVIATRNLDACERVQSHHIAEAIGYRNLDRGDWAERGL